MGRPTSRKLRRPATTADGREQQLSSLAYDLAERQLGDGSASAQVITHFLKAASSRERLEQERLQRENLLLSAKVDQIASANKMDALYEQAIRAMRAYTGQDNGDSDEDEY